MALDRLLKRLEVPTVRAFQDGPRLGIEDDDFDVGHLALAFLPGEPFRQRSLALVSRELLEVQELASLTS